MCSQPAAKAKQNPLAETTEKSLHPNLLSRGDFWLQSPWYLESVLVSEKESILWSVLVFI